MLPNPWLILAAVIFLLVSHGWAFHEGKRVERNEIKAEKLEATKEAIEQADKQSVADNKLVGEEVKIQEKIKIEYRYIREKVNANIEKNSGYAECGLDADGLRLYNSSPDIETSVTEKLSG